MTSKTRQRGRTTRKEPEAIVAADERAGVTETAQIAKAKTEEPSVDAKRVDAALADAAPDDPQTHLNQGIALQSAGRHAEALDPLKAAQKSLPNAPAPFLLAAVSLLALGRPNEALHAASDACYRAPKLPQANYVYGQAWLALNNPARAERAFADAINNAPTWADAWVNYGIARYRQGAIEDAKKAMREALARQPGHAGATANLGAFMRVSAETPALTVWKPTDPAIALGLAVEFLMKRPVFAKLPFGEWADILLGQINRGHFFFAVDERRRVHGMFGWALTQEALAEEWVEGRMELRNEDCREGDCVIANVLAADSADANRALADEGRKVLAGKRLFYAKRYYANGRTRPLRMPGKVLGRYFAGSRR